MAVSFCGFSEKEGPEGPSRALRAPANQKVVYRTICFDSNPSTDLNLRSPHPTTASNILLWQTWAWDLPLVKLFLKKPSTVVMDSPRKLTGKT